MALHRLTALAVVGALALGVSSCGDDSPSPAPSTSSTASSPTPTASGRAAPVLPELASRHDAVGAKAFVRFYFSALTYAMKTGDTELVDRYAAKDCEACAGISQKITTVRNADGHTIGGGWYISRLEYMNDSEAKLHHMVASVRQPAQRLTGPSGNVLHRDAAKRFLFNIWATPRGDGWMLREIETLDRTN